AASLPPMRRPNHASRFEGIAKTNLQASRASDTETLQSQVNKAGKKRLSLSGLEILHGRLRSSAVSAAWATASPDAAQAIAAVKVQAGNSSTSLSTTIPG